LPARFVLVIALLAGLFPVVLDSFQSPAASAGTVPAPACVVGSTNLLTNGSFESPGIPSGTVSYSYNAIGWSGTMAAATPVSAPFDGIAIDGSVYVGITQNSQVIGIGSGYRNATFGISFVETTISDNLLAGATLDGVPFVLNAGGTGQRTGTVTLEGSDFTDGQITLTLQSGENYGIIDNVVLTVIDCGEVPNAVPVFADGADEDQTLEAEGPDGASDYEVPVATDEDAITSANPTGTVDVSCVPAPEADFPIGTTTVTCTAEDTVPTGADELDDPVTVSFAITVEDTTAPELDETSLPGTLIGDVRVLEVTATGPATPVAWAPITADDLVDGELTLACTPASGTAFEVGDTLVTCSAKDHAGNEVTTTFTVRVTDDGDPVVTITGAPATIEATGPDGAPVSFTATATDTVDGDLAPICTTGTPARPLSSGDILPIGTHTVTCTATDEAGNTGEASFTVTVRDTTKPVVTVPGNVTVDGGTTDRARVTFAAPTATDTVDGPITPVTCVDQNGTTITSGMTLAVGTYPVTCSATDTAGQTGTATFTITVRDTSGPSGITWIGGPQRNATYTVGSVPAAPTCTATGTGSPLLQCRVTGYSDQPGTHIMTARARDYAGNVTVETRTYTVVAAPVATSTPRPTTPAPTATPVVTPQPTNPVVTPAPTQPPTAVPTRPVRTPEPTTAPAPTRPPRG
jgi:hypothetical protein